MYIFVLAVSILGLVSEFDLREFAIWSIFMSLTVTYHLITQIRKIVWSLNLAEYVKLDYRFPHNFIFNLILSVDGMNVQ